MDGDAGRGLSALLSQVLVAFTVEFDNEFERRMLDAGYPGARLSLVVWANLMRFLGEGAIAVHDLAARARAPERQIKFELGCLERWRFIMLHPDPSDGRPVPASLHRRAGIELRDGWGSGRGIRSSWLIRLTPKGLAACSIWPPLEGLIESRWEARFGKRRIDRLRSALTALLDRLDVELPMGLPHDSDEVVEYPKRTSPAAPLPPPTLAAMLSQLLLAFRLEFDRESPVPLAFCANTLRVLGEKPVRVSEIARLTGGSPETTDIGWQLKPYVVVEPEPGSSRGKVVRLSVRGLNAQQTYHRLAPEIERRWEARFGAAPVGRLRESLGALFDPPLLIAEGLLAPPGTARAGAQSPALGRRDVGSAAKKRIRDLVAQTEAYLRDAAAALPHYPLWDMNRGFGP